MDIDEPISNNIPTSSNNGIFSKIFQPFNNIRKLKLFNSLVGGLRNNSLNSIFSSHFQDNNIYEPNQRISPNRTTNINKTASPSKQIEKNELLEFLPFHVKSLDDFYASLSKRIGILLIYNEKDYQVMRSSIEKLFDDSELWNILESQFTTYALPAGNKDAKNILSKHNLETPCALFMYNPLKLDKTHSKIILEKTTNLDQLSLYIYKCSQNKENIASPQHHNSQYDQYQEEEDDGSHANIIKRQQEEMRRLEREEEESKKKFLLEQEQKKQKEIEEKNRLEKEKKEKEQKHNLKQHKKKKLPEEPKEDNEKSTHIYFRFPDGEKAERRFYRNDKIGDLYTYIETLDNVQFNHEEGKFDIVQAFPFINFQERKKTLEEEKLFPNAVLQIRERD